MQCKSLFYQSLFAGVIKKNVINLSSAELIERVVKVKVLHLSASTYLDVFRVYTRI